MGHRPLTAWLLVASCMFACSDLIDATGSDQPLRFDPTTCEVTPSSSVLVVFGLDDGDLGLERLDVIRETGAHGTVEEALAAAPIPNRPAMTLSDSLGPFRRWNGQAGEFGGVAWIDERVAEVVFAGPVIAYFGPTSTDHPPADASILVGALPDPPPSVRVSRNSHWGDNAVVDAIGRLGLRTAAYARYAACGEPTVVVYVYTLSIAPLVPAQARGLLLVGGRRAERLVP